MAHTNIAERCSDLKHEETDNESNYEKSCAQLSYHAVRVVLPEIAHDASLVGQAYKRAYNRRKKNPGLTPIQAIKLAAPVSIVRVDAGESAAKEANRRSSTNDLQTMAATARRSAPVRKITAKLKPALEQRKTHEDIVEKDIPVESPGSTTEASERSERSYVEWKASISLIFLSVGAYILMSETSAALGGGVNGWLKAGLLEIGMVALAVARPKSLRHKTAVYLAMGAIAACTLLLLGTNIDTTREKTKTRITAENSSVVRLKDRRAQLVRGTKKQLMDLDQEAEENKKGLTDSIKEAVLLRDQFPENYVSKRLPYVEKISSLRAEIRLDSARINELKRTVTSRAEERLEEIDGKLLAAEKRAGTSGVVDAVQKTALAEKSIRALILCLNIIFGHAFALSIAKS